MNTKVERFKKKIKDRGISPTLIRLKIIEYLDNNNKHPDADTVYRDLKDELPVLSKTSVYNTLNLFAVKGLAMKLSVEAGTTNFDSNPHPNFHFICDTCGALYDVEIMSSFLNKKEIDGHIVSGVQGYFRGKCRNCRIKEKKKEGGLR